jgi:DNA-binding transcriptional ArsR family regulator
MKIEIRVKILKAVADETRYQMVKMLFRQSEIPCQCFVEEFHLSRPALSHHIRVLREAGLIKVRREGRNFYFSLNRQPIERCLIGLLKLSRKGRV